jgi:hypothetical protein
VKSSERISDINNETDKKNIGNIFKKTSNVTTARYISGNSQEERDDDLTNLKYKKESQPEEKKVSSNIMSAGTRRILGKWGVGTSIEPSSLTSIRPWEKLADSLQLFQIISTILPYAMMFWFTNWHLF